MTISKDKKVDYTQRFGSNAHDTGNTKVQIAILTHRINELTGHLKNNTKDHHTRRGLMKMVGQRRRLLNYLERTDITTYRSLIGDLGIRK